MENYNFILPNNLAGSRLDKAICFLISKFSRSQIQKAIKDGNVKINEVIISDSAAKVKENDFIFIELQEAQTNEMNKANIDLDIVYEDEDLIVLNKQAGLTVHPGAGNHQDTLSNALLFHYDSLSDIGGLDRPGIVHRLDKDTSGLMVIAKNNNAHKALSHQIEKRELVRRYKAFIWGTLNPKSGIIKNNIGRSNGNRKKMTILKFGGKEAITYYNTEEIILNGLISIVECKLGTGRTHQIRAQLSHNGHSIIGDQVYGNNNRKINNCPASIVESLTKFKRQALHSWYIGFSHPITMKFLEFESFLPNDMLNLLHSIKNI